MDFLDLNWYPEGSPQSQSPITRPDVIRASEIDSVGMRFLEVFQGLKRVYRNL